MSTRRSTALRDKHRRTIAADEPPCHICRQPIDYALPYMDPGEFVVDHIVPFARGGSDTIDNKRASHRACNQAKSDRMPDHQPRIFQTTRDWR